MNRGPYTFGRSSLVCPALLAVLLGLALVWQPAGAYIVPNRRSLTANEPNLDAADFTTRTFFNRPIRSRLSDASRAERRRNARLHVNVTIVDPAVFQDDQVILECEATGPTPAIVYWLKNGERISQQDNSENLNLVSFDDTDIVKATALTLTTVKSKLYIDCASAEDEAEYTCMAISSEHTKSASYKLQVSRSRNPMSPTGCRAHAKKSHRLSKPARITFWTHNKLVPRGSSVVLVCRAQGPNSVITWLNEETQAVITDSDSDRIHVRDNGDLEIKNVKWADMGGYACQAENEIGVDRQVAFLYPYAP